VKTAASAPVAVTGAAPAAASSAEQTTPIASASTANGSSAPPTPATILNAIFRQIQVTFFNRTPTVTYNASDNVVNSDGTISGRVIGTDPDGDALTYTVTSPVGGGSAVIDDNGYFTYAPGPDFVQDGSTDLFKTTVSDAQSGFHIHGLIGLLVPGWGSTATVATRVGGAAPVGGSPGAGTGTPTGTGSWGEPSRSAYFTDSSVLSDWWVYSGTTQHGNRTPDAISFTGGVMTITGDANRNDAGIAWGPGQTYGAWEVRVRAPEGAANYDPVLLLWPDAENWPTGGEIDFMEIWNDPTRQAVNTVLHYSSSNLQTGATVPIDATQWHTYAVLWTPAEITTYVDGVPFFHTTDTSTFPPGPMHLCIQLDAVGSDISAGATMEVAWAKEYSLAAVS